MSHLMNSLIGATVVASLALVGCGTSSSHSSSSSSSMSMSPTTGMSQENVQSYNNWFTDNINHEFWDTQIVFHPESNVYFDPYSQTYYWEANGTWSKGSSLPTQFSLLRSTRVAVDRRELLSKSGNAEYVMQFNPDFMAFVEDVSPLFESADSQVDYIDQSDNSLSHVNEYDQN